VKGGGTDIHVEREPSTEVQQQHDTRRPTRGGKNSGSQRGRQPTGEMIGDRTKQSPVRLQSGGTDANLVATGGEGSN